MYTALIYKMCVWYRHLAGQKEYEVELEFSSSITGFPSRVNPGEEYRDGEEPIPGSMSSMNSDPRYRKWPSTSEQFTQYLSEEVKSAKEFLNVFLEFYIENGWFNNIYIYRYRNKVS
jgi:hypothetical protein